jgi:hypothetical protein
MTAQIMWFKTDKIITVTKINLLKVYFAEIKKYSNGRYVII